MVKDKRYKTIKILVEGGHISEFREIFENIPKTIVAEQLGFHFNRFNRMIEKAGEIKINDLMLLSNYFDIDENTMFGLINKQYKNAKKSPGRKNGYPSG